MCLIEDENLVAVPRWCEDCTLTQVSGIVNTIVAGSIYFNHIKGTRTTPGQFDAAVAFTAGGVSWTFGAVQTPCQNSRAGCLTATAWAGEKVGVVYPVCFQGCPQRISDLSLADKFGKTLRSITSVEGCGHLASLTEWAYIN